MLLYYWKGCVQVSGYTSKYGNLPKSNQKITRKMLCLNFFISMYLFQVFFCCFYIYIWTLNTTSSQKVTHGLWIVLNTVLANWTCDHPPVIPSAAIWYVLWFCLYFNNFLSFFYILRWTLNCEHSHCNVMARMGTCYFSFRYLWYCSQFSLCYDCFSGYG